MQTTLQTYIIMGFTIGSDQGLAETCRWVAVAHGLETSGHWCWRRTGTWMRYEVYERVGGLLLNFAA